MQHAVRAPVAQEGHRAGSCIDRASERTSGTASDRAERLRSLAEEHPVSASGGPRFGFQVAARRAGPSLTQGDPIRIRSTRDEDATARELRQEGSEELKGDREVLMEAVKRHGVTLELASEDLQCDRELVMEAVTQQGLALEFASEERTLQTRHATSEQLNSQSRVSSKSNQQRTHSFTSARRSCGGTGRSSWRRSGRTAGR